MEWLCFLGLWSQMTLWHNIGMNRRHWWVKLDNWECEVLPRVLGFPLIKDTMLSLLKEWALLPPRLSPRVLDHACKLQTKEGGQ